MTHIFWKQNKTNKYFWLIYFKTEVNYTFSNWFLQWCDYFGPLHQILPLKVQESFQVFDKIINRDFDNLPIELIFFTKLSLAWIFHGNINMGKIQIQNFCISFKSKHMSNGGLASTPLKPQEKASSCGSRLIQNVYKLQTPKTAYFSIKSSNYNSFNNFII
jgi:hypothetical protein